MFDVNKSGYCNQSIDTETNFLPESSLAYDGILPSFIMLMETLSGILPPADVLERGNPLFMLPTISFSGTNIFPFFGFQSPYLIKRLAAIAASPINGQCYPDHTSPFH